MDGFDAALARGPKGLLEGYLRALHDRDLLVGTDGSVAGLETTNDSGTSGGGSEGGGQGGGTRVSSASRVVYGAEANLHFGYRAWEPQPHRTVTGRVQRRLPGSPTALRCAPSHPATVARQHQHKHKESCRFF